MELFENNNIDMHEENEEAFDVAHKNNNLRIIEYLIFDSVTTTKKN